MTRRSTILRGLVVATLLVALMGCERVIETINFKVTIRVDGRDYSSDVVAQMRSDWFSGKATFAPYGRVLTFRLPDNQVIVLGTFWWRQTLQCVPRLDLSDTGCKARLSVSSSVQWADGYVFNSATVPTSVEAFQFEPRDPSFAGRGYMELKNGTLRFRARASDLKIELVSYKARPSRGFTRDSLDSDFPGYELIARDFSRAGINRSALGAAAAALGLPWTRNR